MENISLPSSVIFTLGNIAITNAMLTAFLLTVVFLIVGLSLRKNYGIVPSRFQVIMEALMDYIYTNIKSSFGSEEKASKFFPMLMSMFLFILVMNQLALVPFIFNVVVGEVSLFRLSTSDLSMTFVFALFIIVLSHILAFKVAPLQHANFWIRLKPILTIRKPKDIGSALFDLFFWVLDLIGEAAKVLSLSFRLFGNVFAGEVMVVVIAGLSAYTMFIVPVPFIAISLFSGLIQALVFVFLSAQYIAGTIAQYENTKEEKMENGEGVVTA
jgi:F-type H+-transporting ATPase subunit a